MTIRMTDESRKSLGHQIKLMRKQKGYSQEQLAECIGLKVGTVSKYEQGDRTPNISMVQKIAQVLDCSVNDLLLEGADSGSHNVFDHPATQSYVKWLLAMGIPCTTPPYEDKNRNDKYSILVMIDGEAIDIEDAIERIMEMSAEHFKLLAKQFGKDPFAEE